MMVKRGLALAGKFIGLLPGARSYNRPHRYWTVRHLRFDEARAVGAIGLTEDRNREDYEVKKEHVGRVLNEIIPPPTSVIDAGAGSGMFTRLVVAEGIEQVTAVDFSRIALRGLKSLRTAGGFSVRTIVAPLEEMEVSPADLVMCIDVLFHIVDDGRWRCAVGNIARCARDNIIIQEHLVDRRTSGHHTRWRTLDDYRAELEARWSLTTHERYHLPNEGSHKDLMLWSRTAGK
jgi:hypothetical protein